MGEGGQRGRARECLRFGLLPLALRVSLALVRAVQKRPKKRKLCCLSRD